MRYIIFAAVLAAAAAAVVLALTEVPTEEPKGIKLPKPTLKGKMTVEEAIAKRRSVRSFKAEPLSMEILGQLAWSGQGITHGRFRAAPSAGATYPLELYFVTAAGIYHYLPEKHEFEVTAEADKRAELAKAALGQPWVAEAAVDIVIAAVYERTASRYGKRATLYVHLEGGHVAENILLQAVALDLGGVPIGAFNDDAVKKVVGLPKDQEPIYILSIGQPK